MDELREKLNKLKEKRRIASHINFREVLEENAKSKRPANWDRRVERDKKRLKEEEERLKAERLGQDYYLEKSLNMQADELEKIDRFRSNKNRKDPGFIDFEASTKRQYERLTRNLSKPSDRNEPGTSKQATTSTANETVDSKEGTQRLVESVKQQIDTRNKRSRRRRFDDDADVDYINERNMRYNKKLERFYGTYTDEIKQNFERGTAL